MLEDVHPDLARAGVVLLQVASDQGWLPQITSTVRTLGKQAELYRRYVAGLSQYPAAPPGRSAHNWGWAFDLSVTPYDALWSLGSLWGSWGGGWGGNADPIHFELPGASAWLRSASDDEIAALISS